MQLIRSGLGNHVDYSAQNASVLRFVVMRLDLELLGCVHNGQHGITTAQEVAVDDTVQKKHIGTTPLSVHRWPGETRAGYRHLAQGTRRAACALGCFHRIDPGRQRQELGEVPAVQRQILDRLFRDHGTQFR